MTEWAHQVRLYVTPTMAEAGLGAEAFAGVRAVLGRHGAIAVSQYDAFRAYVEEAEREGVEDYPLYRWTRATLADPAKAAKHRQAFAVRVGGAEVYSRAVADALEADLAALVGRGVVLRLSRHDTNPAGNLAVPAEYR